jgi:hypothetical protein
VADAHECYWPSRPGEPQADWEEPRLIEFPLGTPVDGLSGRLVRLANRNSLKAAGNAVVPQVAEMIGAAISAETVRLGKEQYE